MDKKPTYEELEAKNEWLKMLLKSSRSAEQAAVYQNGQLHMILDAKREKGKDGNITPFRTNSNKETRTLGKPNLHIQHS
jgi:hypothetical protein